MDKSLEVQVSQLFSTVAHYRRKISDPSILAWPRNICHDKNNLLCRYLNRCFFCLYFARSKTCSISNTHPNKRALKKKRNKLMVNCAQLSGKCSWPPTFTFNLLITSLGCLCPQNLHSDSTIPTDDWFICLPQSSLHWWASCKQSSAQLAWHTRGKSSEKLREEWHRFCKYEYKIS